ncbi:MAG: AMP-binding protein, partial [Thermodesulfobacteriota bacterium]
ITAHYTENFNTLMEDIQTKKPTVILSVPRFLEKVYARMLTKIHEQPSWKREVFNWAWNMEKDADVLKNQKKSIPPFLAFKQRLARRYIFSGLKKGLGGRVRWMTAAGAPLSREIAELFNAGGVFVMEGYGLTECSGPVSLNVITSYRYGSAGRPLPCNQVKLAEDGEILIRGGNIFQGYWKNPDLTREAFTEDGWFKTGDIGSFDENGFLSVIDRKKDIIITSGGKNFSPQNIERLFLKDPLFDFFVVFGDRKPYLVALAVLNAAEAARIARSKGIPFDSSEVLNGRTDFLALVDQHIAEKNQLLSRASTIKYYRLVHHPFSEERGELTPSLKIRRKAVMEHYHALIESMYPAVRSLDIFF